METSTLALVISFPVMSSEEIGGILLLNPSSRRRIWHSYSSDLSLQLGSWLHLSFIRIHWPTLQVNSPFCWHPVSFVSRVIWSPEQPELGTVQLCFPGEKDSVLACDQAVTSVGASLKIQLVSQTKSNHDDGFWIP